MPKITAKDITDLGFTQAMFSVIAKTDTAFGELITGVIAEIALELEGRIGSTAYNDATVPNATYVKLAEKCLTAAEMLQRRINVMVQNVHGGGQEFSTDAERKQRQDYLDKVFGNTRANPPVTGLIEKIVAGSSTDGADFSCGSVVTSHFGDDSTS